MRREGLGRRLGILILGSILALGVMCGVIISLDTELVSTEIVHQDQMTYAVENDVLWMIDEQGNRGRLVNLEALYLKANPRQEESGKLLWQ